jgi:predicted DNA-binding transcriptional regulator AlpA
VTEQRRLNVAEAAQFTGLSKSTLNKYRLTGAGPRYFQLGRRVVYDTAELSDWMDARRRRSTSESVTA